MKRELRELKAGALISPSIRSYSRGFTTGAGALERYPNGHGRIYFEDAEGDLITDMISDLSVTLITPNYGSNTQDFYLLGFTASAFENAPVLVESTRPIVKVQMLD